MALALRATAVPRLAKPARQCEYARFVRSRSAQVNPWRLGLSAAAVEPGVSVCRAGFASRGRKVGRDRDGTPSHPVRDPDGDHRGSIREGPPPPEVAGRANAGPLRPAPRGGGPAPGRSTVPARPSFHPVRKTLANRPTDVVTVRGGDVRRQREHESPLSGAVERRRGAEPCPGSVDPGHRPPSLAGSWPGPATVASGVAGRRDPRERRPARGARRRRPTRRFPARWGRAALPR